jgi:hypothetical protein
MSGCGGLKRLLETINSVHQALKFWPVKQVERGFFAGEELEGDAARSGYHSSRFLCGEIAAGDGVERQVNEDSETAHPSAFLVNFFLCGGAFVALVHALARCYVFK